METKMQKEKTKNQHTWERLVSRFSEIPQERKTATPENLRWFLRNGAVLLHRHPEAQDCVYFAQKALDERS
jgi:hypothetical protein